MDKKIKIFIWKVLSGAIPVLDNHCERKMKVDNTCQYCGWEGESINHLLFTFTVSRQLWAVSEFPSPNLGFGNSVYANFHHLLLQCRGHRVPEHIKRRFPWVIWFILRNRNFLFFENQRFNALETLDKILSEVDLWFLSQEIDKDCEKSFTVAGVKEVRRWRPPPDPWLKCNVGCVWHRDQEMGGMAWVLRDKNGTVLLHSRRSFADIGSKLECNFRGIQWAIESMRIHGVKRVIFAFEDAQLVGAVSRPKAWPSFRFYASVLLLSLENFLEWRFELEPHYANRGAFLIARSAVYDDRRHSYVATGHPVWLDYIFVSENFLPSVIAES